MIFLEVTLSDTSDFATELNVHGCFRQGRRGDGDDQPGDRQFH